jgi:hypothetical protein
MGISPLIGLIAMLQAAPAPPSFVIVEPILYFASGSARPLHANGRNLEVIRQYA